MNKFRNFLSNTFKTLNKSLFPASVTCDCCGQDIFQEKYPAICDECFEKLPFIHNGCRKCGKPLTKNKCKYCFNHHSLFTKAYSVFDYIPPISPMIFRFKYGKEFHLKNFFNYFLVAKYSSLAINADCVVNVPMHHDKEIIRIKNQSALLVEEFCKKTQIPNASEYVVKVESTTQTALDSQQRFENVQNSLLILNESYFKNKNVLVIDDIFTTGATANAMASKLFNAGAKSVYVLTICNTGN